MEPAVYLAPLQGLTDHSYRKVYPNYFKGIDRAYTPYFSVNQKNMPAKKKIAGFLQAGAAAFEIVPQILTADPIALLDFAEMVGDMGITMINLNMGCPYPVVTKKGKGAGMLKNPEIVDAFLEKVFSKLNLQLSLKVRLGWHHESEIFSLLPVIKNYPIKEVILHPRIGEDYYEGAPRQDLFVKIGKMLNHKLIYNGDIFNRKGYEDLQNKIPDISEIMLGRGVLQNPFLPMELKGRSDPRNKPEVLQAFMADLFETIGADRSKGQRFPQGIKEFWWHLSNSFKHPASVFDRIKIVNTAAEYEEACCEIWEQYELRI